MSAAVLRAQDLVDRSQQPPSGCCGFGRMAAARGRRLFAEADHDLLAATQQLQVGHLVVCNHPLFETPSSLPDECMCNSLLA